MSLDFLPNTPALINLGTPHGQYAACFVLPLNDSVESIMKALEQTAIIQKEGGGVGYSFSNIRPSGDLVSNFGNVATGPVPFIQLFNSIPDCIKQSGRRHGANIGVLRIDHPDIEEFIISKSSNYDLKNFNISVGITKEFMEALEKDEEFNLINPRTGEAEKSVRPWHLVNLIAESSWKSGDPGVVFLSNINTENPNPHLGEIQATNPCGELPLLPYESCVIGAINLSNLVNEDNNSLNWEKLESVINIGVRFLDNLISINRFPFPEIKESTLATRKIGLGMMGWADSLIKLGIPYDSENAIMASEDLMEFISYHSKAASINLAKQRGRFPKYSGSLYDTDPSWIIRRKKYEDYFFANRPGLAWDKLVNDLKKYGIRNSTVTTIAPTGSLSIIANVSPGIEPLFALSTIKIIEDVNVFEIKGIFKNKMESLGLYNDELENEVGGSGSLIGINHLDSNIKQLFKIAHEINFSRHVEMQSTFQRFVDNAVSKTVNLPKNASKQDITEIFLLAYKSGCKGETIYRYGSKRFQPLYFGTDPDEYSIVPKPVPMGKMSAKRFSIALPPEGKKMTLFISEVDGNPFDVFVILGRSGSDITAYTEAIGRLISMSLRCNIPVNLISENLEGLGGLYPIGYGEEKFASLPDAIGKKLREEYLSSEHYHHHSDICPHCHNLSLEHTEGCMICALCGFEWC